MFLTSSSSSPSPKKKSNFTLFCIQFHAYNHFGVFNNSPMPVNMLLLACEIITLKRNLNYTADRAVRKWLSEYIALICECRHRLRCLCFIYCNRVSFEKEEAKTTSEEIRPRCFTVSLSFTLSTSACCCPAESLVRSFVLLQSELNILSWSFLKQRWCCSWLKYASRQ